MRPQNILKVSTLNLALFVGGLTPILSVSGCAGNCIATESRQVQTCVRREANGHCAHYGYTTRQVCTAYASNPDPSPSYNPSSRRDDQDDGHQILNENTLNELVNRTFHIRYECPQGITGGRLETGERLGNAVTGIFYFFPEPSNPGVPSGSFSVHVTVAYDAPRSRTRWDFKGIYQISIRPFDWIDQPAGYEMLEMTGLVSRGFTKVDPTELESLYIQNDGCFIIPPSEAEG